MLPKRKPFEIERIFKQPKLPVTPETILTQLESNVVTLFCRNNVDGLGDAKAAIDLFIECKKRYADTNTQLKLYLLIEIEKVRVIKLFLPADVKIQECNIEETSPLPSEGGEIILFTFDTDADVYVDHLKTQRDKNKTTGTTSTDEAKEKDDDVSLASVYMLQKIRQSPFLFDHWRNTNLLINISFELPAPSFFSDIPAHCFRYYIGEYGPTMPLFGNEEFYKPPFLSTEIGPEWYEAGMKFDEKVWEYAHLPPLQRVALVDQLEEKYKALFQSYFYYSYPFNPDLADLIVAYVQNQEAADRLLKFAAQTNTKAIRTVVLPLKQVTNEMLTECFSSFKIIRVVSERSDNTYRNQNPNPSPNFVNTLVLVDYMGISEPDLKILQANATMLLGSGDNSISTVFSNPYCLPLFDLPEWKYRFNTKLLEALWIMGAVSSQSHLQNFLLLNNPIDHHYKYDEVVAKLLEQYIGFTAAEFEKTPKKDLSNIRHRASIAYAKQHQAEIIKEWYDFAEQFHVSSFNSTFQKILTSAAIHQYCHESIVQRRSPNQELMNGLQQRYLADYSTYQLSLLYCFILNEDVLQLKSLIDQQQYIPPTSGKYSLTMIAFLLEQPAIVEQLIKKDLDFIVKSFEVFNFPEEEVGKLKKILDKCQVNIEPLRLLEEILYGDQQMAEEGRKAIEALPDTRYSFQENKHLLFWRYTPETQILLVMRKDIAQDMNLDDRTYIIATAGQPPFALTFENPAWIKKPLTPSKLALLNSYLQPEMIAPLKPPAP